MDEVTVCAEDLVAALREALEDIIPEARRAPDWDEKWKELEDFARDTDEN